MTKNIQKEQIKKLAENLKDNSEFYDEFRRKVINAKTDDERADLLIDFIVNEDEIMKQVPEYDSQVAGPTITTIAITTTIS